MLRRTVFIYAVLPIHSLSFSHFKSFVTKGQTLVASVFFVYQLASGIRETGLHYVCILRSSSYFDAWMFECWGEASCCKKIELAMLWVLGEILLFFLFFLSTYVFLILNLYTYISIYIRYRIELKRQWNSVKLKVKSFSFEVVLFIATKRWRQTFS